MSLAAYNKVVQVKTTGGAYATLPANSATLNIGRTLLDDTDFTSTGWISRLAGLKDYSLNVSCMYGSTNTALATLRSALLSGVRLDMKYLPNGTVGFVGRVKVESYNLSGDVAGLETVEISCPASGTALTTM